MAVQAAAEDATPRLEAMRLARGLSKTEVAQSVGVSTPTLTRWENGGSAPSSSKRAALASALGVSLVEIADALGLPRPVTLVPNPAPELPSPDADALEARRARFLEIVLDRLQDEAVDPEWRKTAAMTARALGFNLDGRP